MSGLSEAELHVQAMRLVCEALQDREQDGLEVDWDVIRQMHDQMDAILQALQHKHRYDSSEIVDLRRDRDQWKQARDTAIEGGELLLQSNQTLQAEIETLRTQLDVAQAALTRERLDAEERDREIERLQAFVGGIDNLLEQDRFDRRDIAELLIVLRSNSSATLTSSPTPVAEPIDAEGGK